MSVDLAALVASPHWRWMPGMRTRRPNARFPDGWYRELVTAVEDGEPIAGEDDSERGIRDPLPDLDDPATFGCVEHGLLPAAWGRGHIQTHWTSDGDGSIYIHDENGDEVWRIEMVPKAEAISAALRAAPPKVSL